MKIVTDPHTVAHNWMNKTQDEGRNSGNTLFFKNDKIYSFGHHFCIAKHETNKKNESVVLFTTRGYSNSTSKHISIVMNACWGNIVKCAFPDSSFEKNFEDFERKILEISEFLPTARKPEKYISQIEYQNDLINKYADFKCVKIPAKLKKLMLIASDEEILKKCVKTIQKDRDKTLKLKNQREKEKLNKFNKDVLEWRSSEKRSIDSKTHTGFDILRYDSVLQAIQTSQNITIEQITAERFYHTLKSVLSGSMKQPEKFLDFKVLEINSDFIEIGCHKIKMEEIENIAKQCNF